MAELTLTAADYECPVRWRWVLESGGRFLADHDVRLDEGDWQFQAFHDLYGYLRLHVAPDRGLEHEAEIVAQVGAWAGEAMFGRVGAALLEAAVTSPVTVSVVVPDDPPGARQIAYLPLELAYAGGKPLAVQGITLIMRTRLGKSADGKAGVGQRLRVLAVFSTPDGQHPLNLRHERVASPGSSRRLLTCRAAR